MRRPDRMAAGWLVLACSLALGMVACAPEGVGDLDMKVAALTTCSQGASFGEQRSARIIVREAGACTNPAGEPIVCLNELVTWEGKLDGVVTVNGIREGDDRDVTILTYSGDNPGDGIPDGYARATGVRIRRGESTSIAAVLAHAAGESCPSGAEYTPRVFPAVTPIGQRYVLVSGGFTAASGSGADTRLQADNDAGRAVFLYDSLTGEIRKVADLETGRGGHTGVYLAQKGWVVLFGGASSLPYDPADGEFPLTFTTSELGAALSSFEVLDVSGAVAASSLADAAVTLPASECPTAPCYACCNPDGTPSENPDPQCAVAGVDCRDCRWGERTQMVAGRLFPRAVSTSDEFVIVTGGGDFPAHAEPDYRLADVFDPTSNCVTGGFQEEMVLPRMESIRAGHTMTFVEANELGRFRFLVWGGVSPNGGPIAETYLESSQQFKGLPGVFREVEIANAEPVPRLYFHTLTPLGNRRFLLAGGVRNEGGSFVEPNASDIYLLTLSGEEEIRVAVERLAEPMEGGRFLHDAHLLDGRWVVTYGGFSGFRANALADVARFDGNTGGFRTLPDAAPLPRIGQGSVALSDGTILVAGGFEVPADLEAGQGALEVYAPSVLGYWCAEEEEESCREHAWGVGQ